MKLSAIFLILALGGCAIHGSVPGDAGPFGQDLVIRSRFELYPGYTLTPGRYRLERTTHNSDIFEPNGIAEFNNSIVHLEAFWITNDSAKLCVQTFTHEFCAEVLGLQRGDTYSGADLAHQDRVVVGQPYFVVRLVRDAHLATELVLDLVAGHLPYAGDVARRREDRIRLSVPINSHSGKTAEDVIGIGDGSVRGFTHTRRRELPQYQHVTHGEKSIPRV